MKKDVKINIHIYGISKHEIEKLHNMARKKGYTSLNAYLQFLLRREIENDLMGPEKYDYKNYFESMKNTLLSLSEGYVKAAKRKEQLEENVKRIFELTDSWLFLVDPELEKFGERKELALDKESGIVSERTVEKIIEQEKRKNVDTEDSGNDLLKEISEEKVKGTNEPVANNNSAEMKIRGLTKDDVSGLKLIAKQSKAANLNQFMLDQVYLILRNGGLSIYDNRLADDILEVKDMLFKIADAQTKQELHDMQIIAKLDASIEAVITWIEFMSLAETKQF
ncbi:hypothetical protein [Ligilactobacillus murinus]|nr:hypothetical protein [Ligilactobacillus murinus]NEF81817.1 hypothetical protein [Ligilactobacillus murinus]NEF83944.1 hypothetical protein [Ligilactobacillus murinus]NEF86471.1 hypothetical protein [Ligilactobacillus murinus]NEF88655.1 hypothetical protein [Ligilactobacillus murinus]NEF90922.1 hypothetical protein [Ligilactobacillus murinus]